MILQLPPKYLGLKGFFFIKIFKAINEATDILNL
jgi:hypothetical protein